MKLGLCNVGTGCWYIPILAFFIRWVSTTSIACNAIDATTARIPTLVGKARSTWIFWMTRWVYKFCLADVHRMAKTYAILAFGNDTSLLLITNITGVIEATIVVTLSS